MVKKVDTFNLPSRVYGRALLAFRNLAPTLEV